MEQLDLLSYSPISRNTDPVTSHLAALEVTQDGTRAKQQRAVLTALKSHPGHTSMELSQFSGVLSRYDFARRLPELEDAGLVMKGPKRRCALTGKQAVTWRAI